MAGRSQPARSWLRRAADDEELGELDPWSPAAVAQVLRPGGDWDEIRYIVVDELQEGVAGLVVSPWPRVDDRGRLHFGREDASVRVAVSEQALRALLREERLPVVDGGPPAGAAAESLRERPIAIGDVFAARVRELPAPAGGGGPAGEELVAPETWLDGRILDITADARELTKAQASAAVAGVIDDELIDVIATEQES